MAVPIRSYEDFEHKFKRLRDRSDIFGFMLFDDRPSHRFVAAFAKHNFSWLDQLAAASDMFFFVCIRQNAGEIIENPSLEVAKLFGITARQLPGVVLFNFDKSSDKVSKGVFLPIAAELFEAEPDHVEDVVADLFSLINDCRSHSPTPERLLDVLATRMNELAGRERRRPFIKYLKSLVQKLTELPADFTRAAAEAFIKSSLGGH